MNYYGSTKIEYKLGSSLNYSPRLLQPVTYFILLLLIILNPFLEMKLTTNTKLPSPFHYTHTLPWYRVWSLHRIKFKMPLSPISTLASQPYGNHNWITIIILQRSKSKVISLKTKKNPFSLFLLYFATGSG